MTLDLFAKLKYESRTIILFVGVSIRDLLSDLNNYMPDPQKRQVMSALPLPSARFSKL